jgi:hypothetical protein
VKSHVLRFVASLAAHAAREGRGRGALGGTDCAYGDRLLVNIDVSAFTCNGHRPRYSYSLATCLTTLPHIMQRYAIEGRDAFL